MALVLRLGRKREQRTTLADLGIPSPGLAGTNSARIATTPDSVSGIPAFNRAVRIAAEAVASLRMCVWRGDGVQRKRVDTVWQARLLRDALSESQSRFVFWETVEESLSKRGNSYIWMNSAAGRVTEMYALHPDQVYPYLTTKGIEYKVAAGRGYIDPVGNGFAFYTKGPETILHIRGTGSGGSLVAPSPIEVYREALGVSIAKLRHEGTSYGKGAALRGVVQLPAGVNQDQAERWRDMWRATYEGARGETTGILGGGATFTPISMTMADSQFIESQNFGVAECARIVGVTASLLDEGGSRSTSTPLSPEHEQMRWLRYGLGPRLERIESAFYNEPRLFPYGSSVYPGFETEKFIRGDLTTEDAIAHARVQDGRLLVDEWRQSQGLPDLPDGAGKIPQVVPVGGGANPVGGKDATAEPAPPVEPL